MNAKKLFYALIVLIVVACSSDDVVPVDNGPRLKSIFVGESGYGSPDKYRGDDCNIQQHNSIFAS